MSAIKHRLVVFSCLLLTGFCFWKAAPGLLGNQNSSSVQSAQASANSLNTKKRSVTTPIQDIRPGMRIVGHNPKREEVEPTIDPTPGLWRLLSVRMEKPDGGYFEAQLLRPLSWISRHKAKPGRTIQLNMPEMHVVGAAEVISISDCPPIDPGNDPVVISTFKNVSNNVLNIYVEGESKPIGVTAGHPIWSEDRQEFVHSEKLQVGEKLRSALGHTVRITSIEPRAGPEAVYNLEVAGEHVYCVAESGLLVHNTGPCAPDIALGLKVNRKGEELLQPFADQIGALSQVDWIAKGLADEGPFVKRFYQALYRTSSKGRRIKFNLDDLSLNRALETPRFSDPFEVGATNWEIQQILNNRQFYDATDFFIGNQKLSPQDVVDFGLSFKGK